MATDAGRRPDGSPAADETGAFRQEHVDTVADWSPHLITMMAIARCEDRAGPDDIVRKADVKRQLNEWLSDYREYHAVDYSLGELNEKYDYIEIHKPEPRKTDCRLTDAGRRFLRGFGLDETAAAIDAGED